MASPTHKIEPSGQPTYYTTTGAPVDRLSRQGSYQPRMASTNSPAARVSPTGAQEISTDYMLQSYQPAPYMPVGSGFPSSQYPAGQTTTYPAGQTTTYPAAPTSTYPAAPTSTYPAGQTAGQTTTYPAAQTSVPAANGTSYPATARPALASAATNGAPAAGTTYPAAQQSYPRTSSTNTYPPQPQQRYPSTAQGTTTYPHDGGLGNTVASNQYYIPQGEEVKAVPLGGQPSLGMQPTYRTDKVRTWEAKTFYDTNAGGRDGGRDGLKRGRGGHRGGRHGPHCSRCGHSDDEDSTSYDSLSYSDESSISRHRHRRGPSCPMCRREGRGSRSGSAPRRSHGAHHRGHSGRGDGHRRSRSQEKPRHSSRYDSYDRDRHHRRSRRNRSLSSSAMTSSSDGSSLVVVIGKRISGADLRDMRNPLKSRVRRSLPPRGSRSSGRPESRPRGSASRGTSRSKPHGSSRKPRRGRSLSPSTSTTSSSDGGDKLCPYHANLRKKSRKHPKHPMPTIKERGGSSVSSSDDGTQDFAPQTTHHYFHHYPELPSHKPNPFQSTAGTPLRRQGEEQGPNVATIHHYPVSNKDALKLKAAYPSNPPNPHDRLKIATFEFEQPQETRRVN